MKNPNISFLLQIKPTQASRQIEFNQQSTNNLLSQLKLSLQDVETIINKSKEALGLASSLEIQLCQVEQVRGSNVSKDSGGDRMERKGGREGEEDYGESIYFNVSGDVSKESTIRDQLTYSISLGTFSRVKLEDTETMNIRASRNILRKLDFGQTQSRIQTATISFKQQQISPPKPQLQPQNLPPDAKLIQIQPAATSSPQPQSPQTANKLQQTPNTNKIRQQQQQSYKTTNKKQNLSSMNLWKQQFPNNTYRQIQNQNQSQQPFQLEIKDADHTHGILAFSKMEDMASKFQPYTRDWQFKGEVGEVMQFESLNKPYQGRQKNKEQNVKFQNPKLKQKQEQKQIPNLKQKRKQTYFTQQSAQSTIQSGKWNKYLKQKKAQLTSKHTNGYLSSIQEQPDITLKKPEKSPQRIAPRAQRIKIFKERVMNFNKSTLPATTTTATTNHAKKNVYTHTHDDRFRQNTHANANANQCKGRVSMDDGEMDNTCARNQLENILMLNYASRKTKNNQRFESSLTTGDLFATTQEKQDQKKNFQSLPIKVPQKAIYELQRKSKSKSASRQKPKSPSRSPSRSPAQRKQPQKSSIQHSPIKKPQYIQKYIQNIQKSPISPNQKHSPHTHPQTDYNQSPSQLKYSHVKKSPQNKKPAVFQIQEHLSSQKQKVCTREEFIDKMLQQCYVRRFLSKNQLWRIYDEFCARKVPRYLWEQKVIEKIFKKIHEIDEIM